MPLSLNGHPEQWQRTARRGVYFTDDQRKEIAMKFATTALLVAAAMSFGPLLAAAPTARADNEQVHVGVRPGIAFGYRDGYWDRDHHWHHWSNSGERQDFEAHQRTHYTDRAHGREPDQGWRSNDQYWQRGDNHGGDRRGSD